MRVHQFMARVAVLKFVHQTGGATLTSKGRLGTDLDDADDPLAGTQAIPQFTRELLANEGPDVAEHAVRLLRGLRVRSIPDVAELGHQSVSSSALLRLRTVPPPTRRGGRRGG